MYLKKLIYKNVGPISYNNISFRFTDEGNPIPVVVVGENGTGKSIFLSNITDAFYELAGIVFVNAREKKNDEYQYYKTISSDQIKLGEYWLASYMEFEHEQKKLKYIFKSGDLKYIDFISSMKLEEDQLLKWKDESNFKKAVGENKLVEHIFNTNVISYFSPMRYEKPNWLGDRYHSYDEVTFSHNNRYSGFLYNPISVECNLEKTISWLFDIIADSRADLVKNSSKGYEIAYPSTDVIDFLSVSRRNTEKLLSEILGKEVFFQMGNRSNKGRRLSICTAKGDALVPSLDALSTGQLALLNLFSSIIRYADNGDINLSVQLNKITGIVLIDEIELHLHAKLQREVLPKLIALFPKVQFIITSHSPLFLLGLKETFGEEYIDVYEVPDAVKIPVEDFSEFEKAYDYYSNTQKHRAEIKKVIDSVQEESLPLVISEGSTDWKHMKAAFNALKNDERYSEWLPTLEFEFLEYEPLNSKQEAKIQLQMSCSELEETCRAYSRISTKRTMIFIADNDEPKTKKNLDGSPYKKWCNNVYSFCLPVPRHRENPNICIEHLYSDEELKRKVRFSDGVERRIYLGSEFDSSGHLFEDNVFFYCDAMHSREERERNAIVDGSNKKKVIKVGDGNTNYALPKADFAKRVLNNEEPFNNLDFSSFILIFEKIRDIIKDNQLTSEVTP